MGLLLLLICGGLAVVVLLGCGIGAFVLWRAEPEPSPTPAPAAPVVVKNAPENPKPGQGNEPPPDKDKQLPPVPEKFALALSSPRVNWLGDGTATLDWEVLYKTQGRPEPDSLVILYMAVPDSKGGKPIQIKVFQQKAQDMPANGKIFHRTMKVDPRYFANTKTCDLIVVQTLGDKEPIPLDRWQSVAIGGKAPDLSEAGNPKRLAVTLSAASVARKSDGSGLLEVRVAYKTAGVPQPGGELGLVLVVKDKDGQTRLLPVVRQKTEGLPQAGFFENKAVQLPADCAAAKTCDLIATEHAGGKSVDLHHHNGVPIVDSAPGTNPPAALAMNLNIVTIKQMPDKKLSVLASYHITAGEADKAANYEWHCQLRSPAGEVKEVLLKSLVPKDLNSKVGFLKVDVEQEVVKGTTCEMYMKQINPKGDAVVVSNRPQAVINDVPETFKITLTEAKIVRVPKAKGNVFTAVVHYTTSGPLPPPKKHGCVVVFQVDGMEYKVLLAPLGDKLFKEGDFTGPAFAVPKGTVAPTVDVQAVEFVPGQVQPRVLGELKGQMIQ
jgi:hypothetical protein